MPLIPNWIAQLTQAFERVAADDSARAVVLAGNGKSFCAGADLNWMKGWPTTPERKTIRTACAWRR